MRGSLSGGGAGGSVEVAAVGVGCGVGGMFEVKVLGGGGSAGVKVVGIDGIELSWAEVDSWRFSSRPGSRTNGLIILCELVNRVYSERAEAGLIAQERELWEGDRSRLVASAGSGPTRLARQRCEPRTQRHSDHPGLGQR